MSELTTRAGQMATGSFEAGSDGVPLVERHDAVLLDLDGVVYLGEQPVPRAASAIDAVRSQGVAVRFVTNNAARRPAAVAELLTRVGVPAHTAEVVTSAQAAGWTLAQRLPEGSRILVVGAPALAEEVAAVGLQPVTSADEQPVAVVQGYGPTVGWPQLAEAAVALRQGALWVATNTDRTLPSVRGPLPGNGALVAALSHAMQRQPDIVVGKPEPALLLGAAQNAEAARPVMVGDRLDTDVEGAVRAGMDSLLVFTGVSTPAEVLTAPPQQRPTYLAEDLTGLLQVHPPTVRVPDGAQCRGWQVRRGPKGWELTGDGAPLDALRALCGAVWAEAPQTAASLDPIIGGTASAVDALRTLGLS